MVQRALCFFGMDGFVFRLTSLKEVFWKEYENIEKKLFLKS